MVQKLFVEKNHIPRGLSLEVLTKSFDWSQKLFIKIVIKTFIKLRILKLHILFQYIETKFVTK